MIGKAMMVAAAMLLAAPAVADAGSRTFGWQGPGGRGATGTVTRSWDPETRTGTRSRSVTGSGGRTWGSETVRGCSGGTCGRDTTYTGARGGTTTRSSAWTADGQGGAAGSVTWTGPRGQSGTVERWIRVTPD